MSRRLFFVEKMTVLSWFIEILPRLIWSKLRSGCTTDRCYIIDGSRFSLLVAKLTGRVAGYDVEKLYFRLLDVRDKTGLLIRLRIAYKDLGEVQKGVMKECLLQEELWERKERPRLPAYLAKSIAMNSLAGRETLWRALFLVQICAWKKGVWGANEAATVLFLERRPWSAAMRRYADCYGVMLTDLKLTCLSWRLKRFALTPRSIATLRALRDRLYHLPLLLAGKDERKKLPAAKIDSADRPVAMKARVAVEYHGNLNLSHPEQYSDLFFWQQSSLPGRDILVTFGIPQDPLDQKKWKDLTAREMAAVALYPGASQIPSVPLFAPLPWRSEAPTGGARLSFFRDTRERKWGRRQIRTYDIQRGYWNEFFARYGIRIYVTWRRSDPSQCAIADAMSDVGGVNAIYQRSYQPLPSAEITLDTDIKFAYSPADAGVELCSRSIIRYHVSVGFMGDHRFALLREKAQVVGNALKQHGARHILSFFDENSNDDARWHTGHDLQREHYNFLLEKVLAEPWLGLVVKPKVPSTLRHRLGPVAGLLARAEATGRCYVVEGGALHGSYPPAVGALASDLAIHGHLGAGSAGVEAALAGVPTLLLDREGWPGHPLYGLGIGRVVFQDWQILWKTCLEHWSRPGGIPGFGDWSAMLEEIDPFRDGRAAERMGTYLKWLIDGFKAGLDRETVMADATERYCATWGRDKITEVNYPGKMERLVPKQAVPQQGSLTHVDRGALAARDS